MSTERPYPKLRLSFSLIAMIAVIGAILESLAVRPTRNRELELIRVPETPRKGWGELEVGSRPFPPGEHDEQGERLYGWNCMPCHGAEGKGDGPVAQRLGLHPRDFTRGTFKLKTSPPDQLPFEDDLFRSISTGFPEGAMPSFGDFSLEERWALVDQVKSLAHLTLPDGRILQQFEVHAPKTRLPLPRAETQGNPSRGAELFRSGAQCARCHGDDGRGGGPAAAALLDAQGRTVPMPDLTRGEVIFKGGNRAQDVYRVLATGMEGTPMPSFLALSEADRWELSVFVTSLFRPIPPGEKSFLLFGCNRCHTVGKGKWVGPDLAGIAKRRDAAWLRKWLKDPPAMMASDPAARAMAKEYPVAMPNLGLGNLEVDQLVEYLLSLR